MIRKDGLVKLMDFGIAQILDLAAHDGDRAAPRLAGLHGARAHRGQAARLPHRRLLGRDHALPAGHRAAALRRARTRTRCCAGSPRGKFPDPRDANRARRRPAWRASSRARWRASPTIAIPTSSRCATTCAAYLSEARARPTSRAELRALLRRPGRYEQALPAAPGARAHRVGQDAARRRPRRPALELLEPRARVRPARTPR